MDSSKTNFKALAFKREFTKLSDSTDAKFLQRFFKTGKGEYGDGDKFIGVRVPVIRKVCKKYSKMPLRQIKILLESKIHEHRLAAVILLSAQYKKAEHIEKTKIYDLYLQELKKGNINNWDIVDASCGQIVGEHNRSKKKDILFKLARGNSLWERRVAVIATFPYIRSGDPKTTLSLVRILLKDKEDLLHKACGWMLREIGECVSMEELKRFLEETGAIMPRTMLRYACEKMSFLDKKYYYGLAGRKD